MGRFRPVGQSVYSGWPYSRLCAFGHVWAIPEDAVKPDRLPQGAKAKHSLVDSESEGKV